MKNFFQSQSRISLYLSGVFFGLIIGSWYRKQVGPINWWAVGTGTILLIAAILHEKNKEKDGKS